jgi:hypothetical protein
MKALLVLALMLIVAASGAAYGAGDVTRSVGGFAFALTEPGYMLVSGAALIVIAAALKRLTI